MLLCAGYSGVPQELIRIYSSLDGKSVRRQVDHLNIFQRFAHVLFTNIILPKQVTLPIPKPKHEKEVLVRKGSMLFSKRSLFIGRLWTKE